MEFLVVDATSTKTKPKRKHTPRGLIGIGITTYNRPDLIANTYAKIKALTPGAKIVIVDDGSAEPVRIKNANVYRFPDNVGISMAKNKCLELLDDCQNIFLFDDDCLPITEGWWLPYVESDELHLQYNFVNGPDHWGIRRIGATDGLVSYDRSRGCMLYIDRSVLDIVGGMHHAFGKHGGEHEDWSMRMYKAGLTKQPYQDVDSTNLYCLDEDTSGISSVSYTDNQGWRYVNTDSLPLYAEYRSTGVPILVARRNDNGHRDRLWRYLSTYYWQLPVFEGYHKDGPFNRSLGLNVASTRAGNWDVAVFIDSDAYIKPEALIEAVKLARQTQRVVSPFSRVVELNEASTMAILANKQLIFESSPPYVDRIRTEPMTTQSLFLVVPRNIYEQLGGFDERFVGWGGEDNAFWKAASIAGGEVLRLDGDAYHLWHVPAGRQYQPTNNRRWMLYSQAQTRQDLERIKRRFR